MACRSRSIRKDSEKLGIVTEINGTIKIEWDGGRTSYFRRGERGNIKLKPPPRSDKTRLQNHVHSRRAIGRGRVDA